MERAGAAVWYERHLGLTTTSQSETSVFLDAGNDFLALFKSDTPGMHHFSFGIHKSCGWLKDQFNLGNVAVVANAFCSLNRRHDQSQLNANVAGWGTHV